MDIVTTSQVEQRHRFNRFFIGIVLLTSIVAFSLPALAASNKYHREREQITPVTAPPQETTPAVEPTPTVSIEVNIPATELILFENGKPLMIKPVAIGQGVYPTPEQESQITKIEWNPWWYPPPDAPWAKNDKVTPPGPGNPLGLVKMPLSDAILFHGTNQEKSVGRAASHGCMRMLNNDVVEMAWYLQHHFSSKNDPGLRDLYKKNTKTTYVVELDTPVPVKLVYKPIIVKSDKLIFYPDYYNKFKGKKLKREAILAAIATSEHPPTDLDLTKIDELAAHWPPRGTEIPIESLSKTVEKELTPEKPTRTRGKHPSKYRR